MPDSSLSAGIMIETLSLFSAAVHILLICSLFLLTILICISTVVSDAFHNPLKGFWQII
jgi:hypothetical protein